jgi:high-affinity nickel-transport protein
MVIAAFRVAITRIVASMPDFLVVLALGFFLGMRHATDADHVVAVTTILTRQRDILAAAVTGLLWGLGHTLTVLAVGSAIILLNLAMPSWFGVSMELSVGVMLIVLGLLNVATFFNFRPAMWRRAGVSSSQLVHTHVHSHGDYVHNHPHGHGPDVHPHRPDQTPLAAIDRTFGRSHLYERARPVVVGIVHGLAGSAAVTLLVVAAVPNPAWAIGYLLVFGAGTIAGMMLITMSLASALRFAGARSEAASRRLGLAAGVASIVFGVLFAYQVWSASVGI